MKRALKTCFALIALALPGVAFVVAQQPYQPHVLPFRAYTDTHAETRPFFQFGNLTADIPDSSHTTFVFGGTGGGTGQPHTVGTGCYLSGIWGGYDSTLGNDSFASHIFGSNHSSITGDHCIIVGGGTHTISGGVTGAAAVAGSTHTISMTRGCCLGGYNSQITSTGEYYLSTIAGGHTHVIADSSYSLIAGGSNGEISDSNYSVINGGSSHVIETDAKYAVINGGYNHTITDADYAVINGGLTNAVTANYGVVLAGRGSSVSATYGVAGGRSCVASASGAWAIGDSVDSELDNSTTNSFASRFAGGYDFNGGAAVFESTVQAAGYKSSDGTAGYTGEWTVGVGDVVTIKNGLITGITPAP